MENQDRIVKPPHKVLHRKADAVAPQDIFSPKIQRLISEMKKILSAAPDGVGLAAPQIGVGLRIFIVSEEASIIDRRDSDTNMPMHTNDTDVKRKWEYSVFINPVLKKQSRAKTAIAEGCLSLPGKFGEVARAEKVFLEWLDERGQKHSRGFGKFFARVIQHEIDHLNGILIANRTRKLYAIPPQNSAVEADQRG